MELSHKGDGHIRRLFKEALGRVCRERTGPEEKKRAEETVVGGKGLITKIKFFPLCFHITTSF